MSYKNQAYHDALDNGLYLRIVRAAEIFETLYSTRKDHKEVK